jgi:hypothetical protein
MEEDILSTFDKTPGFNDCISSNLPPRAMRYSMENKNNLKERGSIYVGLGSKRNTTINVGTINGIEQDGVTNTTETVPQKFEIPETGVLEPPTGDGTYVLKLVKDGMDIKMAWIFESDSTTLPEGVEDGIKEVTQELK